MCTSPKLMRTDSQMGLVVKYSEHAPAFWVHTKVGQLRSLSQIQSATKSLPFVVTNFHSASWGKAYINLSVLHVS